MEDKPLINWKEYRDYETERLDPKGFFLKYHRQFEEIFISNLQRIEKEKYESIRTN